MNERIKELAIEADKDVGENISFEFCEKFAELIVRDCVNSEDLLGAIARGWCSKENEHKTMDSDLAVAIFDEVERQIKQHFGVK
jgi:hypothetical protein